MIIIDPYAFFISSVIIIFIIFFMILYHYLNSPLVKMPTVIIVIGFILIIFSAIPMLIVNFQKEQISSNEYELAYINNECYSISDNNINIYVNNIDKNNNEIITIKSLDINNVIITRGYPIRLYESIKYKEFWIFKYEKLSYVLYVE